MEGQEYLNRISADNRPIKKTKTNGIFSSKFFIVGMVGLIALMLIIIVGAILNGGKGGEKNLAFKLKLHFDNTEEIIQKYQPIVKSSDLRSSSASFYSILSNTNRDLTEYLTEKYNFKEKSVDKNITEEATLAKDGLESELFEAKINGILDRIYAHKMAYEISLFTSEEAKIINTTNNTRLKELLTSSYDSLENLYDKFKDFSEAN